VKKTVKRDVKKERERLGGSGGTGRALPEPPSGVDDLGQHLHHKRYAVMHSPEVRTWKTTVRKVRSEMFVRFFGRSTCVAIRLVAMWSGHSTHTFANVGGDRLRGIAELAAVDQSKLSVTEELVGFIRDRTCDLQNAKLGHAEKLRWIAEKSVPL